MVPEVATDAKHTIPLRSHCTRMFGLACRCGRGCMSVDAEHARQLDTLKIEAVKTLEPIP